MEDKFLKPPQEPLHPIITVLRDKDIALVPEGWECAHFRGMMVAVKEGETPRAISLNVCTLVPFEHWPKVVLNKKPVIVDAEFTEVTDDVE